MSLKDAADIVKLRLRKADLSPGELANEALAVIEKLQEALNYYEHMADWQTSCKGCADHLEKSYEAYCAEENERLRARIELLESDPFEHVNFDK